MIRIVPPAPLAASRITLSTVPIGNRTDIRSPGERVEDAVIRHKTGVHSSTRQWRLRPPAPACPSKPATGQQRASREALFTAGKGGDTLCLSARPQGMAGRLRSPGLPAATCVAVTGQHTTWTSARPIYPGHPRLRRRQGLRRHPHPAKVIKHERASTAATTPSCPPSAYRTLSAFFCRAPAISLISFCHCHRRNAQRPRPPARLRLPHDRRVIGARDMDDGLGKRLALPSACRNRPCRAALRARDSAHSTRSDSRAHPGHIATGQRGTRNKELVLGGPQDLRKTHSDAAFPASLFPASLATAAPLHGSDRKRPRKLSAGSETRNAPFRGRFEVSTVSRIGPRPIATAPGD